MKTTQLSI